MAGPELLEHAAAALAGVAPLERLRDLAHALDRARAVLAGPDGRRWDALAFLDRATRQHPARASELVDDYLALAARCEPDVASAPDDAFLTALLEAPGVSAGRLRPLVARLLRQRLADAGAPWPDQRALRDADRPLHALLRLGHVADPAIEAALTRLRAAALGAMATPADAAPAGPFLVSLAMHCFLTEYAFLVTDDEAAALAGLEAAIAAAGPAPPAAALALAACYRSLDTLPGAPWPGLVVPDTLRPLWRQQIEEPALERRLAAAIPSLTAISPASAHVRAMYEANPYPRWGRETFPATAVPARDFVQAQLPGVDAEAVADARPAVLVAGCGTGYAALQWATTVAGCTVTAVDLSRASLGYAARRTAELGVTNIAFRHGDILALGALGRRFGFIDAMGVLHHLADPMAGWRVLAGLLVPGGLMCVGLYSALARRDVGAARRHAAACAYRADPAGIRALRRDALAERAPPALRALRRFDDFYTLSGCRDLVFHVEEHAFTVARIGACLAELDLAFLGFDAPDAVLAGFAARWPDPAAALDLARWQEFETAHPDSFAQMYQFWVQRPA